METNRIEELRSCPLAEYDLRKTIWDGEAWIRSCRAGIGRKPRENRPAYNRDIWCRNQIAIWEPKVAEAKAALQAMGVSV